MALFCLYAQDDANTGLLVSFARFRIRYGYVESKISVFTNGSDSGWIAWNEMHSTSIVAIPFSRSQFETRCGSPSMSATLGLSDHQSWVKPRGTIVIALLITSQPEDVLAHSEFHW